jgi:hypothetical protein
LIGRFSGTSRRKLASSSLFAKREPRWSGSAISDSAQLIVPPIVSSATPTLEAQLDWALLAHVAPEADVVVTLRKARTSAV